MSAPVRRRGRRGLWIGLVLVLAAVGGFVAWRTTRGPTPTTTLAEPLVRGTFLREVSGTGVIEPVQERSLAFSTGGTVAEVLVAEGNDVVAGQVLARLDTATLDREASSLRASLASARADRERLIAQQGVDRLDAQAAVASADDQRLRAVRSVEDAERDLAVAQDLFAAGAAARDEVRAAEGLLDAARRSLAQAELGLESARSRLANLDQLAAAQRASAAAQIAQLEANLANLEARLTDTEIVAPFAGVVTAVAVKSGDLVGSQPVLTVADTSQLRVRGRFDENRAAELVVGQDAVIVPDADTRQRLTARVDRISPVTVRDGGNPQVTAELVFAGDAPLDAAYARPGATVTVRVEVRRVEDALLVPLEAITEGADGSFVYRVDAADATTGVVRRVPVEVLERNPTVAAVVADGLDAGDLIALIAIDELADGDAVAFPPVVGGAGGG
jgi:HlyD family secretion protein